MLSSISRRPHRLLDLQKTLERVTEIEPTWPAWKAWDYKRHVGWSTPSRAGAVPSACLSVTFGGREDFSLSLGPLPRPTADRHADHPADMTQVMGQPWARPVGFVRLGTCVGLGTAGA